MVLTFLLLGTWKLVVEYPETIKYLIIDKNSYFISLVYFFLNSEFIKKNENIENCFSLSKKPNKSERDDLNVVSR